MNTLILNRKDVFTLLIENNTYFCFFSKFSHYVDIIVFIDKNNKKSIKHISLKTLKDRYNPQLVNIEDTSSDFQNFYNSFFCTIKKGSVASVVLDNEYIEGVVIKGGREIIIEFMVDDKKKMVKGPSHLFTLVNN